MKCRADVARITVTVTLNDEEVKLAIAKGATIVGGSNSLLDKVVHYINRGSYVVSGLYGTRADILLFMFDMEFEENPRMLAKAEQIVKRAVQACLDELR